MTKLSAKAKSPANIALVKYWGQSDGSLNLPMSDSISFNLSNAYTETTVSFSKDLKSDTVVLNGKEVDQTFLAKTTKHLDIIRTLAKQKLYAAVETTNNFPTASGIASSASGFSALTLAATKAIGLDLSERELSTIARRGSGSASRSLPDGFVKWHQGKDHESSFAESLYPSDYWKLHDIVIVVAKQQKEVSSAAGHKIAPTSPLFKGRVSGLKKTISRIEDALKNKDFTKLGTISEQEALNMHGVMMTSSPSLMYWTGDTVESMHFVRSLRKQGIECYFTIDAGANIHVLCENKVAKQVKSKFDNLPFVKNTIDNIPANGSRLI